MAAVRPRVTVTQSFATQSTTATLPDLNCIMIGPAYHIEDYNDTNRASIEVDSYGTRNAAGAASGSNSARPLVNTDAVTVAEPPDNALGAILDSDSVVVFFDDCLVEICAAGDGAGVADTNVLTSASSTFITDGVVAGDRVVLTSGATTIERVVLTTPTVETSLTLTANLTVAGTDIEGDAYVAFTMSGIDFRVERQYDDLPVDASFISITGQEVIVEGAVTVSTDGPPAIVSLPVNYARVYMQYRSLRQDLAVLGTVESSTDITTNIGLIDERNPLAVACFVALQNTSTAVQYYGITEDNLNGAEDRLAAYVDAREALSSRRDIYAMVPLANDTATVSMLRAHVIALADPEISNFRIVIGSSELPVTSIISSAVSTGTTESDATDPIVMFVDPTATFVADGVESGQDLIISGAGVLNGTYEVRRVHSETILEVVEADAFASAQTALSKTYSIGTVILNQTSAITTRRYFGRILDNTSTFITDGIIVGDFIEIPITGTSFDNPTRLYPVESIISENRLEIDTDNNPELPSSAGGVSPATTVTYRVVRSLDRDGQVAALNAVTASLRHARLTMVYPATVRVAGVENAYLDAQSDLPGYYLAAAVGGMIAGYPSHQGFTKLGIGGIETVNNSSGYFNDGQIDALSNGGWYVVLQDTPTASPYCVHALTSDTATLESGELMVVKNFDYVSLFFQALLDRFLEGYNVLPETLDLIESAFDSGSARLIGRRFAKIGSPLLDATITQINVTAGSADQVELFAEVTLPRPLNRIGLFLTA